MLEIASRLNRSRLVLSPRFVMNLIKGKRENKMKKSVRLIKNLSISEHNKLISSLSNDKLFDVLDCAWHNHSSVMNDVYKEAHKIFTKQSDIMHPPTALLMSKLIVLISTMAEAQMIIEADEKEYPHGDTIYIISSLIVSLNEVIDEIDEWFKNVTPQTQNQPAEAQSEFVMYLHDVMLPVLIKTIKEIDLCKE
jgi:hypothetical protein